jgi:predicted nucleic acid-binding protein
VILADSNIWIHFLRHGDPLLVEFLLQQRVRTSDVIIGELLLGSGMPKNFRTDLLALPRFPSPSAVETRAFIERHREAFAGTGVGWADAQVIVTTVKVGARLHTSDRGVRKVCKALGVPQAVGGRRST